MKKNLCHRNNSKLPKSISINRHLSKNQKFVNLSKIDVSICVSMATFCTLCPAQFHYLILYIRLVGTSMVSVTEKSFSEGQFSANVQFVDWCEWKHCMFFFILDEREDLYLESTWVVLLTSRPQKTITSTIAWNILIDEKLLKIFEKNGRGVCGERGDCQYGGWVSIWQKCNDHILMGEKCSKYGKYQVCVHILMY